MKIKTKKQLNLPQLIEWAWENKIKNRAFYSNTDGGSVYFDKDGDVYVEHEIAKTETFTIKVEEEITEDTVFQSIVEVTIDDLFAIWECASISTWKNEHSKEFHAYIDGKFQCIWRDGKLVE
jgi:formylmethanofuran dehydrogenase subunit C